jgi:hypothetical protein
VENSVSGNYIGTDAAGTGKLADGTRVRLAAGATGKTLGGTTVPARDLISGNTDYGVDLVDKGTTSNTVAGNYIATDATGTAKLANLYGV